VGGNPPQTHKPRSQGAWPLNPTDICRAKRCPGPGPALAGPGKAWPWPCPKAGPGPGRGSVLFSLFVLVFSVLHMFCILFLVFLVLHMYLFETLFSWRFSLFLCSNVRFQNFVQIGSIVDFFLYIYFSQLSFFDFLFKIPFTMHNI
jgi:hypothetical protein